ncbi:ICOS ligand [Octodon degus]|uniref:ICOS ligand n=1 Tax=Octodon degus TaxID=10160 RepID=A0A6P6EHZ1_OCTDE|nr:ICOS ligand [Octodon degus]
MPLRRPGLLLLLLSGLQAEIQEMEVRTTVGSDCLLSCVYPERLYFNPLDVYVYWQISESTVVAYHIPQNNSSGQVDIHYRARAHLSRQSMEQGNFSLHLRNVTPQDAQKFTCLVFKKSSNMGQILKAVVTLRVAANFSLPVVNSSGDPQDQALTFTCMSTDGYPRPNVYWINKTDNSVLDRALHNDTVSLNAQGLYNVVSVLRLPWVPGASVGCCIENVLLQQNLTGSGPAEHSTGGNPDRITEHPGLPHKESNKAFLGIFVMVLPAAVVVFLIRFRHRWRSSYTGAQAVVQEQELTDHA